MFEEISRYELESIDGGGFGDVLLVVGGVCLVAAGVITIIGTCGGSTPVSGKVIVEGACSIVCGVIAIGSGLAK